MRQIQITGAFLLFTTISVICLIWLSAFSKVQYRQRQIII